MKRPRKVIQFMYWSSSRRIVNEVDVVALSLSLSLSSVSPSLVDWEYVLLAVNFPATNSARQPFIKTLPCMYTVYVIRISLLTVRQLGRGTASFNPCLEDL